MSPVANEAKVKVNVIMNSRESVFCKSMDHVSCLSTLQFHKMNQVELKLIIHMRSSRRYRPVINIEIGT
jgi:hypothetical protein